MKWNHGIDYGPVPAHTWSFFELGSAPLAIDHFVQSLKVHSWLESKWECKLPRVPADCTIEAYNAREKLGFDLCFWAWTLNPPGNRKYTSRRPSDMSRQINRTVTVPESVRSNDHLSVCLSACGVIQSSQSSDHHDAVVLAHPRWVQSHATHHDQQITMSLGWL